MGFGRARKKLHPLIRVSFFSVLCFIELTLSGCATKPYVAKPIEPETLNQQFNAHHFDQPDFQSYLKAHQVDVTTLANKPWGLKELSLSAFYFHPSLAVARAQIAVAESAEFIAADKPKPSINAIGEYHNQKIPQGTGVWALGVGFDIPIERNNKRLIRIERAERLTFASKLDMANRAWQLRQHVRDDLIAIQASQQRQNLLKEEIRLRQSIVSMLTKRKSAGLANNSETVQAMLGLQRAQQALNQEQSRNPELLAALAKSAGVPTIEVQGISLNSNQFSLPLPTNELHTHKQRALLNRLDIRAALERYAAAEAKLKLEIANQKPDVNLMPAYVFDSSQAEQIWSLGISTLFNILKTNGNERMIREATALREVEAAQFYALQTSVLQDMERAELRLKAAISELSFAKEVELNEEKNLSLVLQRFERGTEDRLNLELAKLIHAQARSQTLNASLALEYAKAFYEDAMQAPLDSNEFWDTVSANLPVASNASTTLPPDNEVIP